MNSLPVLLFRPHPCQHARVIVDAVLRRDRPTRAAVVRAVVDEKFPTTSPKERSGFTASMKSAFLSIREVSRSKSNVRQSYAGSSWATNLNIPTSIDPGSGLAAVNMAQPVSPPGTNPG